MNIIEESFQTKEEKKTKKTMKIIIALIILVFLIIIGIISYVIYIQSLELKLTIDGQSNNQITSLLNFDDYNTDGTIYVPIKEIAQYFQYESFDGEYNNGMSETKSKCYVQGTNEIANFSLGSNKIYKLDISDDSNNQYEYLYAKKPVKAIGGVLYASTDAIEKAFNVSFQYDSEKNRITIYTLPYLFQAYQNKVLDYGFIELSDVFANEKAILQNMLVVKKDEQNNKYAVIDTDGNIVLETKYDEIRYLSNTGDFLVQLNEKYGIVSSKKEVKVKIIYSSIELMDSDAGLYVVKNDNNKYGVIDTKGVTKVYIENDEIGIDSSKYKENEIKNKYLLADTLIPVRKGKYWGLFDKYGRQVVDYKYDSLGYNVTASKGDAYNLIVIPNYNVIVVCKDKKYALINLKGEELFPPVADDIYMSISGGKKSYRIVANDNDRDAIKFLEQNGVKATNTEVDTEDNTSSNTTDNSNSNTTTNSDSTETDTTSENSDSE